VKAASDVMKEDGNAALVFDVQQSGNRLSDDVRQLADSGCSGQHWS
jgi:hypothetical protein